MNSERDESKFTLILLRFSCVALLAAVLDAISILDGSLSIQFPAYWDTLIFACLTIASFLLWMGMKRLAQIDPNNFLRPKQLTLASVVGFPIIGLGVGLAFYWAGTPAPRANLGLFGLVVLVLLIGVIAILIGLAGAITGLWRTGVRYDKVWLKQGSVLFFIPFVGLIGAGLLVLGFWTIESGRQRHLAER